MLPCRGCPPSSVGILTHAGVPTCCIGQGTFLMPFLCSDHQQLADVLEHCRLAAYDSHSHLIYHNACCQPHVSLSPPRTPFANYEQTNEMRTVLGEQIDMSASNRRM